MRVSCLLLLAVGLVVGCADRSTGPTANSSGWKLADPSAYEFESPMQLMADGAPIAVEAPGYACPTVADVDGDGKDDLVVGQFMGGKMHFFKNIASTGESPEFAKATFISTGDEPATVPGVW